CCACAEQDHAPAAVTPAMKSRRLIRLPPGSMKSVQREQPSTRGQGYSASAVSHSITRHRRAVELLRLDAGLLDDAAPFHDLVRTVGRELRGAHLDDVGAFRGEQLL